MLHFVERGEGWGGGGASEYRSLAKKRTLKVKKVRQTSLREIQTSLGRTTRARPCRGRPWWHWQDAAQGVPPRDGVGQKGREVQELADAENLESKERKGNSPPRSDPSAFRDRGGELRGVSPPRFPRSVRARPEAPGSAGGVGTASQALGALQREPGALGGARCPCSQRRRPLRLCVQRRYAGGSGLQHPGDSGRRLGLAGRSQTAAPPFAKTPEWTM